MIAYREIYRNGVVKYEEYTEFEEIFDAVEASQEQKQQAKQQALKEARLKAHRARIQHEVVEEKELNASDEKDDVPHAKRSPLLLPPGTDRRYDVEYVERLMGDIRTNGTDTSVQQLLVHLGKHTNQPFDLGREIHRKLRKIPSKNEF